MPSGTPGTAQVRRSKADERGQSDRKPSSNLQRTRQTKRRLRVLLCNRRPRRSTWGIASGLQFRVDERYEVDGDAEVVVKTGSMGTMLRGSILDISTTGCYIQDNGARTDQNPVPKSVSSSRYMG